MQPLLPLFVLIIYSAASFSFWKVYKYKNNVLWALSLMALAVQAHGILLFLEVKQDNMLDLSIFKVISLYSWGVATLSIFWIWRQSMSLAGMIVCIFCVIFVLLPNIFVSNKVFSKHLSSGMLWHIFTSLASWTVLSLSILHAVLYSWLFQRLKQKQLRNIQPISLVGLERGMILLAFLGFIFLSASLFTGWLFVENLFAQHLVHKTILTMLAWLALGILLYLERYKNLHGLSIVYGLLGVFALLLTGYVLSNIILQFLITR